MEDRKAIYRSSLLSLAAEIIITAIVLVILFTCVIGITVQQGNDMYPSVRDGDIVIYYRSASILPSEAVVYRIRDTIRIGRTAAAGGSVIDETGDHQITVDGIYQPVSVKNGVYSRTYSSDEEKLPVRLRDGEYYILNDDRTRMDDSRTYGAVSEDQILGRVITVIRRRLI